MKNVSTGMWERAADAALPRVLHTSHAGHLCSTRGMSCHREVSLQSTLVSLDFSHQGLVIAHVIIINYYYY